MEAGVAAGLIQRQCQTTEHFSSLVRPRYKCLVMPDAAFMGSQLVQRQEKDYRLGFRYSQMMHFTTVGQWKIKKNNYELLFFVIISKNPKKGTLLNSYKDPGRWTCINLT